MCNMISNVRIFYGFFSSVQYIDSSFIMCDCNWMVRISIKISSLRLLTISHVKSYKQYCMHTFTSILTVKETSWVVVDYRSQPIVCYNQFSQVLVLFDLLRLISYRGVRTNYLTLAWLYHGNYFGLKKEFTVFSAVTNC